MKRMSPLALFVSIGLVVGCAGVKQGVTASGKGGSGASTGSGGSGGSGGSVPPPSTCNGPCDDWRRPVRPRRHERLRPVGFGADFQRQRQRQRPLPLRATRRDAVPEQLAPPAFQLDGDG